ncbi:MAG: phenylalanine--tRNA ligase beta subunit-related protein [Acidimicrobiia bacterium]|nr:phenylalanine--tRNA ligase beta subunit-related protein [Acidimicrobiia bacterium]
MTTFGYDTALLDRYSTIRASVVYATNLVNGPSPQELQTEYLAEQEAVKNRFGGMSPAEVPSLAAWRKAFSDFGVKPTQYRNAAEALLRRLTKHGDIPSISLLVDIGNLISIRYTLPVAFFDQAAVTGATTVRFAHGDESFTDLGSDHADAPEPGEVVFVDDAGLVSARRWCWRQSAQSATGAETIEAIVTIEGHHRDAAADVAAACDDIFELLGRYQPQASVRGAQLSAASPSASF